MSFGHFTKEHNLGNFLLAFLHNEVLRKLGRALKGKNLFLGEINSSLLTLVHSDLYGVLTVLSAKGLKLIPAGTLKGRLNMRMT